MIFQPFRLHTPLASLWLEWLAAALAGSGAATMATPADWDIALPAIERHGLAPLLYTTLKEVFLTGPLPADAATTLAAAFQASAARSLRLELEIERITAALAAEDVPCLLLKGAALGRTIYGSPAERPVSDLDVLVPRTNLAAAQRCLAGQGYRLLGPPAGGRLGRWFYRYRAEAAAVGCAAENQGLLVEAHWTLTELPYYMERITAADIWQHARPLPDLPAAVPDPAVLLIHACAHLALHHSRDLRLIWLVDIDRLAHWNALDWERVVALAGDWGLGLAVSACLEATNRWLGTLAPVAARTALARLAEEPIGRAMWGLGDETLPGRWWRRPSATWTAFDARQRARYAGWLALRLLLLPTAWLGYP